MSIECSLIFSAFSDISVWMENTSVVREHFQNENYIFKYFQINIDIAYILI